MHHQTGDNRGNWPSSGGSTKRAFSLNDRAQPPNQHLYFLGKNCNVVSIAMLTQALFPPACISRQQGIQRFLSLVRVMLPNRSFHPLQPFTPNRSPQHTFMYLTHLIPWLTSLPNGPGSQPKPFSPVSASQNSQHHSRGLAGGTVTGSQKPTCLVKRGDKEVILCQGTCAHTHKLETIPLSLKK